MHNADGHGIVPDGFHLKIVGGAQFPCTVLLCSFGVRNPILPIIINRNQ